jgi:hypothetical protein
MIRTWRSSIPWQQFAVMVLILFGVVLRIRQYLTGRSLWLDEAMLALNILQRNFADLFKPLGLNQAAPIGFLLVEKTASLLFGKNEYSLRLFPLVLGISSLWTFYLLLKCVTRGAGLLTALALFALNPRLIYYSSELKQYIVDVALTIGLLLLAYRLFDSDVQKRDFAWMVAAGFIALWFSHSAVFVLAGIGLSLAIVYLRRHDYSHLRHLLLVGVVWIATIVILYFLVLGSLQQSSFMREYWQGGFVPFPPWVDIGWVLNSIQTNIETQFGISSAEYLVFGLMLVGWGALWRYHKGYAATLGFIPLLAAIASMFHLYPFVGRMILFLLPIGFLLLGKAVEVVLQGMRSQPVVGVIAGLILSAYLILAPLLTSIEYFVKPKYSEHIRPTMGYLQSAWHAGDLMFISYGAVPAFQYYAAMYQLTQVSYISSRWEDYQDPGIILQQLDTLKGKPRVWILLSHVYEKGEFNEKDYVLDYLRQNGKKKREFRVPGSSVYLYLFDLQN